MDWFKHHVDRDFTGRLLYEFGANGYLVYYSALECLCEAFNRDTPCTATIERVSFSNLTRVDWDKVEPVLYFCASLDRFSVVISQDTFTITVPDCHAFTDGCPPSGGRKMFPSFWEAYPGLKRDKKKCQDVWASKCLDGKIADILDGLNREKRWRAGSKPGAFVPEWKLPLTYLRGECWNDEFNLPTEQPPAPIKPPSTFPDIERFRADCAEVYPKSVRWIEKQKDALKEEINEQSYAAFIEPMFVCGNHDGVPVVYAGPCASWVEEHYKDLIVQIVGCDIELTSVIPPEYAATIADDNTP